MANKATFLSIKFTGLPELKLLLLRQKQQLLFNIEAAVRDTVLYGIALIAKDTPVDTGRLRGSIGGELSELAGVSSEGPDFEAGKRKSLTRLNMRKGHVFAGRIGTNVEYALAVEYGHTVKGPSKLNRKQLAYLFATGKLTKDSAGNVVLNYVRKTSGRSKGRGMFRKNAPLIRRYFNQAMARAVNHALQLKPYVEGGPRA